MKTINKTIKMKKGLTLTAFLFNLLLFLQACNENPPVTPPPPPTEMKDTITITIEDVTHRSITVNVKSTVYNPQSAIRLYRQLNSNDVLLAEYPITVEDTTIIDDDNGIGLLLDTTYTYYAVRIDSTGALKDTSSNVTARTLAPTTHNYTWTEYTIGEWQSYLTDVWGTDENNMYACGTVMINDTAYGVLKWNGIEWLPHKRIGGVSSLYGFSDSDFWAVGEGAVEYWDGNKWTRIDASLNNGNVTVFDSVLFYNNPYTSLWGTSSSNLYLGNIYGKIIHWDGLEAEVIAELDDITITDLFGSNSSLIIASLSNLVPPGEAFLFNGIQWNKIPGLNPDLLYKSAYLVSANEYYVVGEELLLNSNGNWSIPYQTDVLLECIRGNRQTGDIVAVGHFSTLLHYNGIDWQKFQFQLTQYTPLSGVYLTKNRIFAVGAFGNQARIIIGIRN